MDFNERFMEVWFKMKERERLQGLRARAEGRLRELEEKKSRLFEILKKEEKDVEKLEGISLSRFIHRIKGDMEDVLYKEQQEKIAAKLRFDEASYELDLVKSEIQRAENGLMELQGIEEKYMTLIKEKEEYLKNNSSTFTHEIEGIVEREAGLRKEIKELQEALDAGSELSEALQDINESLDSAEGWGTFDMFGGGFFATMAKHSHLDEANEKINRAQSLLTRFHRELSDLGETLDISIDIDSFLGFADYFFDGFFADWAVQSRIEESKSQVEDAQFRINSLMGKIEERISVTEGEFQSLEKQRLERIEKA